MSKYVDLDKIIDKLEDEWGYEGIREDLYELPCADVVEAVRCKDCKYCESAPKWKDFELGCMLHREYTMETDYCSQAERKQKK